MNRQLSDTILKAAKIVGRSLDSKIIIDTILKLIADELALEKARVVLPEDEAFMRIRYSYDISQSDVEKGRYSIGEGVTGRVMQTGEIAVIPNIKEDARFLAHVDQAHEFQDGLSISFIAVPIICDDEIFGVLGVYPKKRGQDEIEGYLYVLQVLAILIGQVLRIEQLVSEKTDQLKSCCDELERSCAQGTIYGILGQSQALQTAISKALRASRSSASVLMLGESGTGKERFARMIHLASKRRDKPFVCINCAAIPKSLLESELFGHEKGSFTGAVSQRRGKFELASGGTLFLDEIGDMDIDLQAKLLRTLQEGTIQRIGGHSDVKVDVRVVAATHQNMDRLVREKHFRLDLYFRLNVLNIVLPPLRERDGDVRLLAHYFVNRDNQRYGRNLSLPANAIEKLEQYSWPGNIRQLENVIERAVIMHDKDVIGARDIGQFLEEEPTFAEKTVEQTQTATQHDPRPYQRVKDNELESIKEALAYSKGNKTIAAKRLGMSTRQLYYRLKKLGAMADVSQGE